MNPVVFHDCDVKRVTSGQRRAVLSDFASPEGVLFLDPNHFIDYGQCGLECGSDCFPSSDRCIAMNDFLQYLRVRNQPFASRDETLQQDLSLRFVRMRRADQVHGNVGVDKGHPW